jgi:hypothetical protein
MEKKSKWKLMIIPASLFILAFGLYVGYTLWETENNEDVKRIRDATAAKSEERQQVAFFHTESDSRDYKNVGSFISDYHARYNETLGWGGIDSVKWEEQIETAAEIRNILANIHTENTQLQSDFEAILQFSKTVEEGRKDKKTLLKLHRYFHDLDIEFNGYKQTNDYYDVTEYKASEGD